MAKDMSVVGYAASASKRDAGLTGKEAFDDKGGINISRSDNGGFILRVSMKKVQPPRKNENCPSTYCEPKNLTFDDKDAAFAAAAKFFGGQ